MEWSAEHEIGRPVQSVNVSWIYDGEIGCGWGIPTETLCYGTLFLGWDGAKRGLYLNRFFIFLKLNQKNQQLS